MRSYLYTLLVLATISWVPLKAQNFQFAPILGQQYDFLQKERDFSTWSKQHTLSQTKGWKYYKRWEQETQMHTNAQGQPVKPELFMEELVKALPVKNGNTQSLSTNAWISEGPSQLPPSDNPTSQHGLGRINCMAFHPNIPSTYWVGVAQGGIWKTEDDGSTWTPQGDNLPIMRISDIAVDPSNPAILYAALGDFEYIGFGELSYGNKRNSYYGMGIYKSIDGGANWSPTGLAYSLSNSYTSLIRKIIVHPTNSNRLVAAGTTGIHVSNDGGTTWTQPLDSLFWDLTQDPLNPDVLYAAGGYINNENTGYAAIYKSNNFGQNWQLLNTGIPGVGVVERTKISIAPSDPNYIYAICTNLDRGLYGIYKSTNAGATWSMAYNALNILEWYDGSNVGGQGTYDLVLQVDPSDKNKVYVGGVNLWSSSDGAASFDPVSYWTGDFGPSIHADQHFMAVQPLTGRFFECNDGGIYRTAFMQSQFWSNAQAGSDWPTVWTNISSGMAISSFYRVSTSGRSDGLLLAGAQDNSSTYFNGTSWKSVVGGDGMDNWLSANDPSQLICSSQYGNFYGSQDGGFNFQSLQISMETAEWTTPLVGDRQANETLYAGYGNIFSSSDGFTWDQISVFPPDAGSGYQPELTAIAVAASNPQVLMTTRRVRYEYNIPGVCYRTSDGGGSWQDITAGLPDSLYFTGLEISHNNPLLAWVTCAGFTSGVKVFETQDGGLHWTNISYNLPNLPVNVIKQLPNTIDNQLVVGTDIGVYIKGVHETHWTLWSNSLPNVIVCDLEYNAANKKLYAATFGRAIWSMSLPDSLMASIIHPLPKQESLLLFPCPAKAASICSFKSSIVKGCFQLVDVQGKVFYKALFDAANEATVRFQAPTEKGVYILRVIGKDRSEEQKLIVQ